MEEREFTRKEFKKFYEEIKKSFVNGETTYHETKAFNEWLDEMQENLFKVVADSAERIPVKEGQIEAAILGIARFTCTFLVNLQRRGMVTDGVDIFRIYCEVLLPECHELIIDELKDEEDLDELLRWILRDERRMHDTKAIFSALSNDKITEEEIFEKYIHTGDREECLKYLRTMRKEILKGK